MSYRDRAYDKYTSTHISPYKGEVTLETLKARAIIWEKTFGRFLPENRDAQIMDLGCGYGSIVWWLQQAGFAHASGVDISAEQVETGRKLGVSNIEQGNIKEYLRDKKACYDVIFARDIIEHLHKEEIMETLSLGCAALKDGGRMIVQVPNAESPFGGRLRYGDFTHEISFTSGSIAQVMRTAGFDGIRIYPHEPLLFWDPLRLGRWILWQIVKAFYKFLLWAELGSLSKRSMVSLNIIVVTTKTSQDTTPR